jgi:predicted phosphodiesterase
MSEKVISRRRFVQKALLFSGPGLLTSFPVRRNRKNPLRIAVASDGHYGQPEVPYAADYAQVVNYLNQERRQRGLDFSVFNGDLIHDDPRFLPLVKQSLSGLDHPYFVTRGNHDRVSADVWKQTWGYSTNHDFEYKGYAFVLADTSNEKGDYLCPDLDWLQQRLTHYKNHRRVFIFMHITPHTWTRHGADCPQLSDLLSRYANIDTLFHGHDHDEDALKTGQHRHFFDGHFGGSWGTPYKGYRILEISHNTIHTYQYNPVAGKVMNADKLK